MPATFSGPVIRFAGDGRKLGWPTANLSVQTDLTEGVYFGFADMGAYTDHPALVFIGKAVTTGDERRRVEAHLLDIEDRDYYSQELRLDVRHFHRPNQKFGSLKELIRAIKTDEAAGRRWFKQHKLAS